ncbi:hypothetical protein BGW80DRAFT_1411277, partial [Lactifluus volemus]
MSIALEIAQTQRVTLFSDVNSREARGKEKSHNKLVWSDFHHKVGGVMSIKEKEIVYSGQNERQSCLRGRITIPHPASLRQSTIPPGGAGGVRGKQPDVSRKRRWTRPRPS